MSTSTSTSTSAVDVIGRKCLASRASQALMRAYGFVVRATSQEPFLHLSLSTDGMELVSGTPLPFWSQSYPCLSGIRYGAGEWTDPFYFTLPRERTRPLREDVRGFPRFCLGTSRQVEY